MFKRNLKILLLICLATSTFCLKPSAMQKRLNVKAAFHGLTNIKDLEQRASAIIMFLNKDESINDTSRIENVLRLVEEFLITARNHYTTLDKKIELCYNLNETCIEFYNIYKENLKIPSFNEDDESEKFKSIRELFMFFVFYHAYFFGMVRDIFLETIKDEAIRKHIMTMRIGIEKFSEILNYQNIKIDPRLLEIYKLLSDQADRMNKIKSYLNFDYIFQIPD